MCRLSTVREVRGSRFSTDKMRSDSWRHGSDRPVRPYREGSALGLRRVGILVRSPIPPR